MRERLRERSIVELTGCSAAEVSRTWLEACSTPAFYEATLRLHQYGQFGRFSAAKELYTIVRLVHPRTVIETGVGSGYSSLHILEALRRNGHGRLYSIDLPNADPTFALGAGLSTGFIVPEELRSLWDLRIGPTSEHLVPMLGAMNQVDLFFHDSGHDYSNMMFELTTLFPRMSEGGLLIVDDSISNAAILDFSKAVKGPLVPLFDGSILRPSAIRLILSLRKH